MPDHFAKMRKKPKTFGRRRAVLVGSDFNLQQNHPRFRHDVSAFYGLLRDKYQFKRSDIRVLFSQGGFYPMGPDPAVHCQDATESNVTAALRTHSQPLGPDDLFVLFMSGHGTDAPHCFQLWGGTYVSPDDIRREVSDEPYLLGIFGQCYSDRMFFAFEGNKGKTKRDKTVLAAASTSKSEALPPDCAYNSFLYHMTSALAERTPSGYQADADARNDGHVDANEAFEFAKRMTKRNTVDRPRLYDSADGGTSIADQLTIDGLL